MTTSGAASSGRDPDRYLYCGRTHAGRLVLVVLVDDGGGLAGPISAREPTEAERRRYFD